ncbi:hypothetical protein MHYP_G00133100 [Metynnis hypsauchen]
MVAVLITLSATLLFFRGSAVCNVVQNPPDLIKNQNDTAEIKCAHTVKDYNRILWYKHDQATSFKFMGYLNFETPNPEAEFENIKLSGDSGVTQSPSVLWVQKGKPAEMNCSQTKGISYSQMYWFRQQQVKPIELIVFTRTSSKPDFGNFSQEKFSATKEKAESGSFTVKNVESDDSALYFCAVSQHSDTVLLHC